MPSHSKSLFVSKVKNPDAEAIPVFKGDSAKVPESAQADFKGDVGEVLFLYPEKTKTRLALVGLGDPEKVTKETLRRSYGALAKAAIKKKLKSLTIDPPKIDGLSQSQVIEGAAEGILFSNYHFGKYQQEPKGLLQEIGLKGVKPETETLFQAVNFARDLVNGDADEITPDVLAKEAKKLGSGKVLNKAALKKEKMGLMLAVSKGSVHEPYLIALEYRGNPKSKEKICLIGKGVTYDTGGLNLKSVSMETMKADMGGAAAVLGAFKAAKELKLKVNLSVVVPTVENAIGSGSYKPGSVYPSHSGKSVEIGNTDAEGRLILADAISWAKKHVKPTQIIDCATLTGAMRVAIGDEGMGLFSNNDALADSLVNAGMETFERAFRFPLIEEYKEELKSDVADICNIGKGRLAGAITAALFLEAFIGDTPWAHLDMAPSAFITSEKRYYPKFATGIGVRLLVEYLRHV
ncbi:MAG: leucyl aminopeptidase family protein [Chlamydiia bacterium]|nr:leucyl aminopeptidase family protein [Chlamydiia bacterium]